MSAFLLVLGLELVWIMEVPKNQGKVKYESLGLESQEK